MVLNAHRNEFQKAATGASGTQCIAVKQSNYASAYKPTYKRTDNCLSLKNTTLIIIYASALLIIELINYVIRYQ